MLTPVELPLLSGPEPHMPLHPQRLLLLLTTLKSIYDCLLCIWGLVVQHQGVAEAQPGVHLKVGSLVLQHKWNAKRHITATIRISRGIPLYTIYLSTLYLTHLNKMSHQLGDIFHSG